MKRIVGIVTLLFLVPFAIFVLGAPASASGASYVIGAVVLASALVVNRAWTQRAAIAGSVLLVAPVLIRVFCTKEAGQVRTIDRIVDERDVSVNAARAIAWTQFLADPDVPVLADSMRDAYDVMGREEGALPSPFVATYLGLEAPHASDTIEFTHDGEDAVVFLHGSAGNFTMSCWLFARAAARAGMATSCPSTSWVGDWWNPQGEAIVRETLASLRARGKKRIFLAGLSNGAIGASRLAPRMSAELAGLVLVSGAAPDATASNVPTLVLQGRGDTQIHASVSHTYATRTGAKYVELDAGHFVLLVQRERTERLITEWLASTRGGSGRSRA